MKGKSQQDQLIEIIAKCTHDPLLFTQIAYEWGKGELASSPGPRKWQKDIFDTIGTHLQNPQTRFQPLRIAVSSGHGAGKSALVSQIIHWGLSTKVGTKVVVTAGTETQLRTKTWPEVAKWIRLGINREWFKTTATSVQVVDNPEEWRADAITWSENNTDAFAGLHNEGKRIVLVYDEASAVDDKIWEVAEGALTDENTEIIWLAFGNPVRSSGRFRDCFEAHKKYWVTRHIDSRTVEGTNKKYFEDLIESYGGEEDDRSRYRVRGLFPISASTQFITKEEANTSANRMPEASSYDPLIFGIDIARQGDDSTIIAIRRGRDAKSIPWVKMRERDTTVIGDRIMKMMDYYNPDAVFIDGGGVGAGVVDYIRRRKYQVTEIQFGSSPSNDGIYLDAKPNYFNKRAEMYGELRAWLKGGAMPPDVELVKQLTSIEYRYKPKKGIDCLLLESKDEMRSRGLSSPDEADALALCFGGNVQPSRHRLPGSDAANTHTVDYNPLSPDYINK